MGTTRSYGAWSSAMLQTLREGDFKVEAFVSWLGARGIHVDRSLVSHWAAGRTHLPADLLPLLAEFSGRPDLVFGPYVRPLGWELVDLERAVPSDEDLVDLMLSASALLGRLHEALAHARSPDSPGGVVITTEEREALQERVDALIHLLAGVRRRLGAR